MKFKNLIGAAATALLLGGCGSSISSGPVSVSVIQPIAGRACGYQVAPARLETMTSLSALQGSLGRVVYFPGDVDNSASTLETGAGFLSIDTQFMKGSDGYVASDYRTLLGASLYYAVETGYKLHARLNAAADFAAKDSSFAAKTTIIADARRADSPGGPYVEDNAEYFPHNRADGTLLNYLISYPNRDVAELPLGLNLGIMVHEYTHLVFHNLFYEPGFHRHSNVTEGTESELTLAAIDEGLADYFGYLATGDAAFFQCSFPGENRNLAQPKQLTQAMRDALKTGDNYDSHEGGAVFAAVNYEIGQAIGPEENGKLLSALMVDFLTCPELKGTTGLKFTFEGVARCHIRLAGARSTEVQAAYSRALGGAL